MTARRAKPVPAGDGDPAGRNCEDCVPALWIQGGAWGWKAHRFALHDEGENPGSHPAPARGPEREWPRWNDAQRADFHHRNRAARRRKQHTPPAPRQGPPGSAL